VREETVEIERVGRRRVAISIEEQWMSDPVGLGGE
jgi:hypothetical protein